MYTISFPRDFEGLRQLAVFTAQLVKESVHFTVKSDMYGMEVTITGGF